MTKEEARLSVSAAIRRLEAEAYCRGVELGAATLRNLIHDLRQQGAHTHEHVMARLVSSCNSLSRTAINTREKC